MEKEKQITADDLELDLDTNDKSEDREDEVSSVNQIEGQADNDERITHSTPQFEQGEPTLNRDEIERNEKISKKKNKTVRNVLLGLLAIIVFVGGGYGLFQVFYKEAFSVFDYVEFTTVGLEGNAEVVMQVKDNADELNDIETLTMLRKINYQYSENYDIKNGDTITITIDEKDAAMSRSKKKPTELKKEITASGLKQMPGTWNDVNEKEMVLSKAIENVDDLASKLQRYYEIQSEEIGVGTPTTEKELIGTFYKVSSAEQCISYLKGLPNDSYSCGNVVVLYKITVIPGAGAYFTEGDGVNYEMGVAKNIVNTEEGTTSDEVAAFQMYLDFDIDLENRSESEFVKKIEAQGFVRI